ncbi:metal ion transporter [Penicillium canariense]|uniref:Metal ion transporter n=1 Tax=Penicillium canariense TaxID=189055 RepID=A0A9W9LED9_9EURO|nr:metal ion transporter [Penicillium canariense]KAJ5151055.1 metal ion transporter [Penicillium canariense]
MDSPGTLKPGLGEAAPGQQRVSSSQSSPRKSPQRSNYPLSTENKAGNGPIGGREQEHGPATPSGTRLETPAPDNGPAGKTSKSSKRRKNRNRKRRNRQQSFLTSSVEEADDRPGTAQGTGGARESMEGDRPTSKDHLPFFPLRRNLSNTSLESDALLDHRDQPMMRPRRDSRPATSFRPSSLLSGAFRSNDGQSRNTPRSGRVQQYQEGDSDGSDANDRTPLIRAPSGQASGLSRYGTDSRSSPFSRPRRASVQTFSSQYSPGGHYSPPYTPDVERDYDVNNPPSIPGTPKLGPDMNYDDAVVTGIEFDFSVGRSIDTRRESGNRLNDAVINMENGAQQRSEPSSLHSGHYSPQELRRRRTVALPVEEDVCFPTEDISELGDEERRVPRDEQGERRRRRRRQWPDLPVLEEWSREEKEIRGGDLRVKKISEPMLVEGRLRPQYKTWRREEDDAPYRFTYFNEELQSTIHAQTISELVQPGGSFRELFIPDPPELEDSSSEEEPDGDHFVSENLGAGHWGHTTGNGSRGSGSYFDNHSANNHNGTTSGAVDTRNGHDSASGTINAQRGNQNPRLSVISEQRPGSTRPGSTREHSPSHSNTQEKPKRYGPRPTFWLDVLSPTDAEMRVIAKAFGIHALTAEDIMMQEAREKVELFRSYYFVNYRTFEQDRNSEDYLEPVNMYVVVFREGVLSFHFSQTPHPANVRRRIRQLMDYLILSSDWISYALIDDITDVFGPLIQAIEDEVDEIDEKIMQMHSSSKEGDSVPPTFGPGEMLRRTGECRKKVMGLYRLLSNKADVVKGFAKRCNEQWEVAPKSEIGLYLGDIQDHIMTMTGNLTHYETILSRAHSNYLAQINILMNERQEQTADVLGKLTVLGTIVLPMNIICGMWGMNVKVPGQDIDDLWWFWSITGGLLFFGLASFLIAKRVYKIV